MLRSRSGMVELVVVVELKRVGCETSVIKEELLGLGARAKGCTAHHTQPSEDEAHPNVTFQVLVRPRKLKR